MSKWTIQGYRLQPKVVGDHRMLPFDLPIEGEPFAAEIRQDGAMVVWTKRPTPERENDSDTTFNNVPATISTKSAFPQPHWSDRSRLRAP